MAVCFHGDEKRMEYVGCTLATYEHNGPWDSDYYAVVWDKDDGCVKKIEYATTRFPDDGSWAVADATDDVKRSVYRYFKKVAKGRFDSVYKIADAKAVRKGDDVVVIRGRKVPKGTRGKVFWVGKVYNRFSRKNEDRVGIESDGAKVFLSADYVEVVDWEKRILTGRKRKEAIRKGTLRLVAREAWLPARAFDGVLVS